MHLRQRNARINGQDWVKLFITRLIKISHTQWIFRNLTLHDRQLGHLAQLRRKELASELERLHSLDSDDVPKESQFLLDFDIDDLAEGDIFLQEQWIIAMRAAHRAGMRARGRSRRLGISIICALKLLSNFSIENNPSSHHPIDNNTINNGAIAGPS
jgi:hypothetical protein